MESRQGVRNVRIVKYWMSYPWTRVTGGAAGAAHKCEWTENRHWGTFNIYPIDY